MTAGRSTIPLRQDWCTPAKLADAAKEMLGSIELDPCSNPDSIIDAIQRFELPHQDGLKEDWDAATIFVNPPYGRDPIRRTTIKEWLAKCSHAADGGSEVIALIPVATNTSHWKQFIFGKAAAICFLADTRLRFRVGGNEQNKGCPMATCIVYWGADQTKFESVYARHGTIVALA